MDGEKINHLNIKHKKAGVAMISNTVRFKTRNTTRNENHFTITKGDNSSKRHNVFVTSNRPSNKRSSNLQVGRDKCTTTVKKKKKNTTYEILFDHK